MVLGGHFEFLYTFFFYYIFQIILESFIEIKISFSNRSFIITVIGNWDIS